MGRRRDEVPHQMPASDVWRIAAKAKFLDVIGRGYSITKACQAADIDTRTARNWRDEDLDFCAAWDEASTAGLNVLEDEAVRRAVDGVERPVFGRGERIGEITEYSDTLLMFVLKGRLRQKYGDKTSVEFMGNMGTTRQVAKKIAEAKSPQEAARMYQQMMGMEPNEEDE